MNKVTKVGSMFLRIEDERGVLMLINVGQIQTVELCHLTKTHVRVSIGDETIRIPDVTVEDFVESISQFREVTNDN